MPFIPHTPQETQQMLDAIGVNQIADLFKEVPKHLQDFTFGVVPNGLTEMEMTRLMKERAQQQRVDRCFIGAGAYEHHVPAAVLAISQRGEFLTAYTPYQAEASQGTLQLLWEYQTMMASLMGLDVSNASLYDGATAAVEAVLMAIRLSPSVKNPCVWIPANLNPHYREVLSTLLPLQKIAIRELPYDPKTGTLSVDMLQQQWEQTQDCHILVLGQPNFFGCIEEVDDLTDWAKSKSAQVIGVVNPTAMAMLKPPGQWGKQGADIACGEGQPLGVPLQGGGPYFGFICSRKAHVRQMPGRLVGLTVDKLNQRAFTLTLQAREQHIRRERATSNICTNQGLLVTMATVYLSLMGPQGLARVAQTSHQRTTMLIQLLRDIKGVKLAFNGPHFHEFVVQLPCDPNKVLQGMKQHQIDAGFCISKAYPAIPNGLLICVTETKSEQDLLDYAKAMEQSL